MDEVVADDRRKDGWIQKVSAKKQIEQQTTVLVYL